LYQQGQHPSLLHREQHESDLGFFCLVFSCLKLVDCVDILSSDSFSSDGQEFGPPLSKGATTLLIFGGRNCTHVICWKSHYTNCAFGPSCPFYSGESFLFMDLLVLLQERISLGFVCRGVMHVCLDPQIFRTSVGMYSSLACISHPWFSLIEMLIFGPPSVLATGLLDYSQDRGMSMRLPSPV
jgi:hypothetical protein